MYQMNVCGIFRSIADDVSIICRLSRRINNKQQRNISGKSTLFKYHYHRTNKMF